MSDKLLPQIPVLTEYIQVKNEIELRINKLNSIQVLTAENQKEVKSAIAEINKVKDRISRYRIDNTNNFLKYIEPYIEQCKELEKLCSDGISDIKAKVSELEMKEKEEKIDTINKLFDFHMQECIFKNLLKFEMFFEKSMANKSASLTVIENNLKKWIEDKTNDLKFIKNNTDEPEVIMQLYLKNDLNLTKSIENYQERYKSEAEIKAIIATEENKNCNNIEKKIDICIKIKQLPKSKVHALQSFLDNLGIEFEVEKL